MFLIPWMLHDPLSISNNSHLCASGIIRADRAWKVDSFCFKWNLAPVLSKKYNLEIRTSRYQTWHGRSGSKDEITFRWMGSTLWVFRKWMEQWGSGKAGRVDEGKHCARVIYPLTSHVFPHLLFLHTRIITSRAHAQSVYWVLKSSMLQLVCNVKFLSLCVFLPSDCQINSSLHLW